jgi:hypothetical protein
MFLISEYILEKSRFVYEDPGRMSNHVFLDEVFSDVKKPSQVKPCVAP